MQRRAFCKGTITTAGLALGYPAFPLANPGEPPPPELKGLTAYVCDFITRTRYEDLPEEVLALGAKSILDGLGLALAGSRSTLAPLLERYLTTLCPSPGRSSILGTAQKVPPRFAAFANGAFIHADDYDDTQLATRSDRVYGLLTHPTVPVLPAALALSEAGARAGRDLLTAYHVGVEVECKLAEAISPRHYNEGFHTTGTVGVFGSAAACAKLLGLDRLRTAHALGLAASQAGGLRRNFGSMTKPFHAGHAAEAGVVAADLAALGWTAAPDILEGTFGFFQAAGGGFDPAAVADQLGRPWSLASPGVSIKPFPSGSLTHPAMGELLRLIRTFDLKPSEVERIDVGANSSMVTTLLHHRPVTGLQAKFSMEFGLAILVLDRKAGLAEYTDAVVQRRDVQELLRRVDFHVDPEAERAGLDKMTSLLSVRLRDGRVVTGRAQFAKGSPADPMSYAEVAEKFRGCAAFAGWPSDKAEAVVEQVRPLGRLANAANLAALLAR